MGNKSMSSKNVTQMNRPHFGSTVKNIGYHINKQKARLSEKWDIWFGKQKDNRKKE
ncbi:MAG: hypothetical protein WC254_03095 [Candidatus Woesearchaeota archaeon]|jgi:hypothetical protein